MPKYEPKHRDRVKIKGRGGRVWRVLSWNTNAVMVEATGDQYEVTWAARDDLTKATAPKPKPDPE